MRHRVHFLYKTLSLYVKEEKAEFVFELKKEEKN